MIRGTLRRPVTVTMLCLAVMVVGLVGLSVIPLQLLPDGFESQGMTLIFPYPDADPLMIEREIVRPVEEVLATIPDLQEVEVHARKGRARINLEFSGRTDMNLAALEVRDRLERVRPDLPREAQRFFMWRHSASSFPDMAYAALVPEELGLEGYQILENRIMPRLNQVDGVAGVDTWGGLIDQEARLYLDQDAVRAHRVDLGALIQRLQSENFNLPTGTITEGDRELFVRTAATFDSLNEVEEYPVDDNLKLRDLGEGTLVAGYRDRVSRMDGRRMVWMVLNKESGRNTVEVCGNVREQVEQIRQDPEFEDFELISIWDQGESIEAALLTLEESILWGGLLSVLVLLLFFRDLRATLLVAAAIPFSALVALALLVAFDYTLNILTLAGLTLAVGMLLDNAIVVVENVVRRREAGEPMFDAAAHGASEVGLAIALATFTTIVVFLPLIFVSDEPGLRVMISNLAGPISFGLLASLATALLVVPMVAARLRIQPLLAESTGPLAFCRKQTLRVIEWTMRHRIEVVVLFLVLCAAGGEFLRGQMEEVGEESRMIESVRVRVGLDEATTLTEANEIFKKYEEFLQPRKDEFGARHVQVRFDRQGGRIELRLKPSGERPGEEEIREKLKDELPRYPGVALGFGRGWGDVEESDDESGTVSISLYGSETEALYELADDLAERLETTGRFDEVSSGVSDGLREFQVSLDSEAAERLGVAPETVMNTLSYQLRGSRLADLRVGDDDIPFIISYETPDSGEGTGWVKSASIFSPGGPVPLQSLANFETTRGPRSIRRVDRRTQVEVVATLPRSEVARGHQLAEEVMATFPLPEGFGYEIGGAFKSFKRQEQEIQKVLGLGTIFMLLLMGILFESFLLPLAVMPAIPFAFLGGYFALYVTDTPMDVVAMLGSVVLAGIVVNNAIVLVDAINQSLREGSTSTGAVLAGVKKRFRPVMLTAATTIAGLLPMAWTPASEGVMSYHSLARAVIGGLAISTIGTLIVVPLFWLLLDDLRRFMSRLAARFWQRV